MCLATASRAGRNTPHAAIRNRATNINDGNTTGRQWAEPMATNGWLHGRLRAGSHSRRHLQRRQAGSGLRPTIWKHRDSSAPAMSAGTSSQSKRKPSHQPSGSATSTAEEWLSHGGACRVQRERQRGFADPTPDHDDLHGGNVTPPGTAAG